ncbi:vacuolar membrane-associated protein iml1 [Coemansia sp. RSA 1939]|nr:vacuolar membrane-associated protein iml1 [Coemansia sp. RSA 1939]
MDKSRPTKQKSTTTTTTTTTTTKDNSDKDGDEANLQPDPRREILLQVGEVRKDTQQIQASMSNFVARTMWGEYLTNQRVAIRKIDMHNSEERESIRADFVEIAFRDQYVGRSDMWRLWRHLSMKTLYNDKPANMEGLIRANVRRIYKDNVQVPCGYIDSSTQPIFRSESGRFIILIQMSEEMWAYQEDGNMCFEKAVNCFLADLFKRWKEKQVNHMVTIVMFSRWYYHIRDSLFFQDLIYDDYSGLYYRDYYKVIADMGVYQDWAVLLPEILIEFNTYRRDIQEVCTQTGHRLRGDLSKACRGNILEAINMGINSFATNHVDRDLSRTGLSTIVITPSFGVFDVQKRLLRMTTERMLHFGIRVDLVCLEPRPLFRPPVFRFKSLPVPSEQEQRRALHARARAKMDARRAKDSELNSVSPHAESPGAYANVAPGTLSGNMAKERAVKAAAAPDHDASVTVDPIMLDPLYFDDEKWEANVLPYASGRNPRNGPAIGSRDARTNTWQYGPPTDGLAVTATERSVSAPDPVRERGHDHGPEITSIVNALLPENGSSSDIPETIKGLHMSDFSYFNQRDGERKKDRRVVYCYFPYWIDCGFYNYTEESPVTRKGSFQPSCKMGDLSITGVPSYLKDTPFVSNLKLKQLDTDLASLLASEGLTGSDNGSSVHGVSYRMHDDDAQSADEYTFTGQTKELSRDSIGPLNQHPIVSEEERERMIGIFRMYDHEAIVGTGNVLAKPSLVDSAGMASDMVGSSSLAPAYLHTTSTTEARQLSGQANMSLQSSQGSNAPMNSVTQWDDSQLMHALDTKSSSAEKADGASAGSMDHIDHMVATVSTSASPNIPPGQHIKPPTRRDHPTSMSSSAPHEPRVSGPGSSSHSNQRSSIFVRGISAAQRKRSQQLQFEQQTNSQNSTSSPGKSMATIGTSDAAGGSSLKQLDSQQKLLSNTSSPPSNTQVTNAVVIGGSGAIPDSTARQFLQRISESPQSLSQGHANMMSGGLDKSVFGAQSAEFAKSSRAAVSESIARQSHLDDHVRTFKGKSSQEHQNQHQRQQSQPPQPPTLVSAQNYQQHMGTIAMLTGGPIVQRQLGFNHGIIGEHDFQLTLPGRSQVTPVSAAPTQPTVPSEYNGNSPQHLRSAWLADRVILSRLPEPSPRGPRRGYYYPYNPCNPELFPLPHTELSQRWAFAFANYSSVSSFTPKWRSICTPASLPLVTDYFPTDLEMFYQKYMYHLQTPDIAIEDMIELPPEDYTEFVPFMTGRATANAAAVRYMGLTGETARIDRSTRIMLKEMVYQRLAQGFQFITTRESKSTRGIQDITARVGARVTPRFKSGNRSDTGSAGGAGADSFAAPAPGHTGLLPAAPVEKLDESIWLSNGRQIQQLEFRNNSNSSHVPGVNVTRWERKKLYDRTDVEYRFHMWSRNNNMGYCQSNVRFTYPREDEVNWNNLDYLLNGYQNAPLKSMKYWRARYILIPVDQLSNDTFINAKANPHMSIVDVRIANFEKFLDHIIRRLRKSEKADLEEAFLGALPPEMRKSVLNQQQQEQQQQQQQQQSSSSGLPRKTGNNTLSSDTRKLIGLQDIVPSALLQIRYTSLCPVAYNSHQLYCYMNDKIYSDPSKKLALPPPVTSALGLSVPLNVESPFTQLAYALQHPVAGIALRNIRWHTSYFEEAFVSFQLVDWTLVNFESALKRSQAATLANRLLERGLVRSLNKPGPFADGYYFYEFTDAAKAWRSHPIHQQVPRTHASIMSSIGFSDLGNRHSGVSGIGGGSNTVSPNISRPESRQGSNAPSVVNDADSTLAIASTSDNPVLTTATATATTTSTATATTTATSDANSSITHISGLNSATNLSAANNSGISAPPIRRQTTATRISDLKESSTHDSFADLRSSGAQPANKLRVRTDMSSSITQLHADQKDTPSARSGEVTSRDGLVNLTKEKPRLSQGAKTSTPLSAQQGIAAGEREQAESAAALGQKAPSPSIVSADYTKVPDVFPHLSQRKTRRPLPKSLTQSRMFALDLDQQRKSTRIEQCLVHLDATQNPMTCFHLSINWLNCTSHLIDELVQGWGRVAERCGMRLVEAPRAQDSYTHENHPFHSPLRVNLALQPPPVEEIFDDEWVAEFLCYGDDDSEPDEYTSDSDDSESEHRAAAEQSVLAHKRRVLRRLKRCIPSYPFERELLEEQDFILDVEAEAEFPPSSLLQREYTFERAEHKHTQYVHRSGTAFVRICGPGKFMWINNYLYTSHQVHMRPQANQNAQQSMQNTGGAPPNATSSGANGQQSGATGAFGLRGDGVLEGLAMVGTGPGAGSGNGFGIRGPTMYGGDGLGLSQAYGVSTSGHMVPSYYPVQNGREMWPHQMLKSLAMYRSPSRRFHIPELYSVKIVDNLGAQPADFDSVNAAITRVAVMRKTLGTRALQNISRSQEFELMGSYGPNDVSGTEDSGSYTSSSSEYARSPDALLLSDRIKRLGGLYDNKKNNNGGNGLPGNPGGPGDERTGGTTPPAAVPNEPNPDMLRAQFVEICRDKNGLEMFWQRTISRYRSGWRDYMSGNPATIETPKRRPMVADVFTDGIWQRRHCSTVPSAQ